MSKITSGIVAGLAATIVLSLIMVAKGMMGLMPGLDVIAMLSAMMGAAPIIGWLAHFMIGMLAWGVGFALVSGVLPGTTNLLKGISFGVAAWLMMMLAVMPAAGAGFFGLNMGMMAPLMTLMLHVIFGAVLGSVYGKLAGSGTTAAADQ